MANDGVKQQIINKYNKKHSYLIYRVQCEIERFFFGIYSFSISCLCCRIFVL